ncbi:hypothetical protein VTI74DRAFT_1834 [Chaetomium olivicolor]
MERVVADCNTDARTRNPTTATTADRKAFADIQSGSVVTDPGVNRSMGCATRQSLRWPRVMPRAPVSAPAQA